MDKTNQQTDTFKTFPEFSKLTITDKGAYETLISGYPPISDISFASLLTWWNSLDSCAISVFNHNLIISYWAPGDEHNTGLSFIGTTRVDASVCAIFDYQRVKDQAPRLVHVPEIVIGYMHHPELFKFTVEPDYAEAVYPVSGFYPLEGATEHVRTKIKRFLSRIDETRLTARPIDLRLLANQKLLLGCSDKWFQKGGFNDVAKIDRDAIKIAVTNATEFDIRNVCLYLDDELIGFQLYQIPSDKRYVISTFVKVDCTIPGAAEYMFYVCAQKFAGLGAVYMNAEQDLGISNLRAEKLAFGPCNYFRKYTIEPAS